MYFIYEKCVVLTYSILTNVFFCIVVVSAHPHQCQRCRCHAPYTIYIYQLFTFTYHTRLSVFWQESCAMAKMTAQCAIQYMGALKIFGTPWLRPRLLFPTVFTGFCRIDPLNVPTKFEVRSFIRSSDNRGYPQSLDSPWIRPRSLFSKIFNRLLFRLTLYMYPPNL